MVDKYYNTNDPNFMYDEAAIKAMIKYIEEILEEHHENISKVYPEGNDPKPWMRIKVDYSGLDILK